MRRDEERVLDIRTAAEAAIQFADGHARGDLDRDPVLAAALVYQMIVIGEAAGSISESARQRMPAVPWNAMAGMRNLIVHAYWRIDLDEVWRTVHDDLPRLLETLSETRGDT